MILRTLLLCEFGFYAYHRVLGHSGWLKLHDAHHDESRAPALAQPDEVRGAVAMVLAHAAGPIRVHAVAYYAYLGALLAIHRAIHWPEPPRVLQFHAQHHLMHHAHPDANFGIVTPLMDLLFGTLRPAWCAARARG